MRWGLTALAVVLVIMLIALLIPDLDPRTYIMQLAIVKYDRLVPPIEFLEDDYGTLDKRLNALPEDAGTVLQNEGGRTRAFAELQTSASFDQFSDLFGNKSLLPKDVLVLFVSIHGISHDGEAYLACSDFLRGSGTQVTGIYPLSKFLDHVDRCEAATKFVVLDTGRLQYDPRIGLLLNEFPQMLAREVQKRSDPNLYVFCGASMMEYPNLRFGRNKTLFTGLVVDGLLGKADTLQDNGVENPDQRVTLAELYKFVVNRMADYYPSDMSLAQTPFLAQGTKGLLDDYSEIEKNEVFLISLFDIQALNEKLAKEKEEAERKKQEAQEAAATGGRGGLRHLAQQLASVNRGLVSLQQPSPTGGASGTPPAGGTAPPAGGAASTPASGNATAPPPGGNATTPPAGGSGSAPPASASPAAPQSPSAGGSPAEPKDRLKELILQAWAQRDRLQQRQVNGGWSPIDFAPHFWRLLNERLLDFERRWLARYDLSAGERERLTSELEREISGLELLARVMKENRPWGGSQDRLVSDKLLAAWDAFNANQRTKLSFEAASSSIPLKRAALEFHDQVHRAVYYVRWYDRYSFTLADKVPGTQDVERYLVELGELQAALEREAYPGDLNRRIDSLKTIQGSIDDTIRKEWRDALADAASKDKHRAAQVAKRKLWDLLQTPLLEASERRQSLDQLMRAAPEPDRIEELAHTRIPSLAIRPEQWRALRQRLEFQTQLVKLVDADVYTQLAEQIRRMPDSDTADEEAIDNLVQAYRSAGARLRGFYAESLVSKINDANAQWASNPTDTETIRTGKFALRLLDARDATRVPKPNFMLIPHIESAPVFEGVQVIAEPSQLKLSIDPNEPQRLNLEIKYSGDKSSLAIATLAFKPHLIGVRNVDTGAELNPNERLSALKLIQDNRIRKTLLRLEVWAKSDTSTGTVETDLQVDVQVAEHSAKPPAVVTCVLPNKNFVELVVKREGVYSYPDKNDYLQIEPFPNRETSYSMALQNHSGVAKEVTVRLLAIPLPTIEGPWGAGRLFYQTGEQRQLFQNIVNEVFVPGSNRKEVSPRAQLLAETKPFPLPADMATTVPIPFEPPGAIAAAAAAATGNPPPPPAAEEKKPDPEITYGMVLVVHDPANDASWIKWIETRPMRPSDYMTAKVAYDSELEEIEVLVKPRDDDANSDGFPDLIPRTVAEDPIDVQWDLEASEGLANKQSTNYGEYNGGDPDQEVIRLNVTGIENDNTKREIWLTVDGYPRAMAFTVVCEERASGDAVWDDPSRRLRDNAKRLELKSMAMPSPNYKQMFFYTKGGEVSQKLTALAKGLEKVPVFLDVGQPAWFPSTKVTAPVDFESVEVKLEVDAPYVAFTNANSDSDFIEIGFDGDTHRYFSDRQIDTRLLGVTSTGQVRVRSTVSDYKLQLRTRGYSRLRKDFWAKLEVNENLLAGAKPHPVIFDDQLPVLSDEFMKPDRNKAIPIGANLEVSVEATALSGIDRVEFAIDPKGERDWAKLEPVADRSSGQRRVDNRYGQTLSTKDLQPGRSYDVLVRAYDRIGLQPSETLRIPFVLAQPPAQPANGGAPAAVKGVIKGHISTGNFRNFKPGAVTVVLEGNGEKRTAKNEANGNFEFKDLDVGPVYKLSAEGTFQFSPIYGELEVKATAIGKDPPDHNLNMDDPPPVDPLQP